MNVFKKIKKDIAINQVSKLKFLVSLIVPNSFNAILWIRLYHFLEVRRIPTFLAHRYLYHIHSLEFAEGVLIGGGLRIPHPFGILFCKNTQIGEYVTINGNVRFTLRGGRGPKVGNQCFIGDGAILLGVAVINDNSAVGAGAVVTKEFPPNSVVCGVPAKLIKNRDVSKIFVPTNED